jgi:alpha-L-fucosidase
MKRSASLLIVLLLIALSPILSLAQKASPEALNAWREARLGMFIHWGPVSLTGLEISWSRANTNPKCPNNGPTPAEVYDQLYKTFNPIHFNAKEWVSLAREAGMKYMILTAKHCDGFLLWDSKVDDYNIMNTPFKRDVCAELAAAAHEAGMKFGWYFSPMDWRDPDCRNAGNEAFVRRMQSELTELLSNYGKIDILWFDTDGREAPWDQENTYQLVRRLQPNIVINERLDLGDQGGWNEGIIGKHADFHTPEQTVGKFDQRPWESCMTVSKRNQWSWGGADDGVKSFEQIKDMLIGCAGSDGNMLLNVGPMPDGRIAPEQASLLRELGRWLSINGSSIYGTRGGPWEPTPAFVSTHRGKTVYLHVRDGSVNPVELPLLTAKILSAKLLSGETVPIKQTVNGVTLSLPSALAGQQDPIVVLELER